MFLNHTRIFVTALALAPCAAPAQSILTRSTMFGDVGGLRTEAADAGVTFKGFYDGNFADVMSGGKKQGNGYAQQLGLGADLDMGKLLGLDGGTLHIAFNQREGRNVSSDFIGNKIAVQENYGAGETLRISEFSYDQYFDGKKLNVKIGFYPMGNDFAVTLKLCDFENDAFCAHPQSLPNSSGWSDYPTGKWGGRIKYMPTPSVYIMTGVYDVNPGYYQRRNGLKIGLSNSTGALIPLEAGYISAIGAARMPGHYKAGVYYDTSGAASVTNAAKTVDGRYGWYLLADQMVVSFDGGPKRGLYAFGQVSFSDAATSKAQGTILGALIADGLFAARPADYLDVGYVRTVLNHRAIAAEQKADPALNNLAEGEGALEFGYGLQATPWLVVNPNFQYIMQPGAFSYSQIPNAWVFGLRVRATL